jgi:hypothetical protein
LRQDQNHFYGAQIVPSFMVSIKLSFLINSLRLLIEAGIGLIRLTNPLILDDPESAGKSMASA